MTVVHISDGAAQPSVDSGALQGLRDLLDIVLRDFGSRLGHDSTAAYEDEFERLTAKSDGSATRPVLAIWAARMANEDPSSSTGDCDDG